MVYIIIHYIIVSLIYSFICDINIISYCYTLISYHIIKSYYYTFHIIYTFTHQKSWRKLVTRYFGSSVGVSAGSATNTWPGPFLGAPFSIPQRLWDMISLIGNVSLLSLQCMDNLVCLFNKLHVMYIYIYYLYLRRRIVSPKNMCQPNMFRWNQPQKAVSPSSAMPHLCEAVQCPP